MLISKNSLLSIAAPILILINANKATRLCLLQLQTPLSPQIKQNGDFVFNEKYIQEFLLSLICL